MSLGGIAIAIGEMIDAGVVMVENAHKHLERRGSRTREEAILDACREVGPALFFSLLIIAVSFVPVFTLEAQEGRLFAPLAYTKTFAMLGGALLSVTLLPMLMVYLIRGRILPEAKNPLNRALIAGYRPIIAGVLKFRWLTVFAAAAVAVASLWPASKLGRRVHAGAERGHAVLHADVAARHVGDQGGRAGAAAGPDHQELSGSRLGHRQGGAGGDRHRSRAAGDVRDGDQSEAGVRVASGDDDRQADRRNGQGAAVSRRVQQLDDADPGAHRHAVDRASARRSASRCSGRTSTRWSGSRARSKPS